MIFASDRDGIWNLYAYRWDDGAFFRVTRLLGGATQPDLSPDGRHIVFRGYEAGGWRLEEITFDAGNLEAVRVPGRQLPAPSRGPRPLPWPRETSWKGSLAHSLKQALVPRLQ